MLAITGQDENGRGVVDTRTDLIQNILRQLAAAGMTQQGVTRTLEDGLAWIRYWLRCTLVRYYISVWLANEGSLDRDEVERQFNILYNFFYIYTFFYKIFCLI